MEGQSTQEQLEAEGWVKKFTIDKERLPEYIELYENIGLEVRVEAVVPAEVEGCNTCFEAECNKFMVIYTRARANGKEKMQ